MSEKIVWALVLGIIGGFTFAVGTALYSKTETKLKLGESTASPAIGSPTES